MNVLIGLNLILCGINVYLSYDAFKQNQLWTGCISLVVSSFSLLAVLL